MRKILLSLICIGFCLYSSAQSDSLEEKKKQLEKLTIEKVYSDVKSGFSTLVGNLQGPAKHVYEVYVYQHRTRGIVKGIASLLVLIFFGTLALNHWKPAEWGPDEFNRSSLLVIIGCIGLAISMAGTLMYISNGLTELINPEYHAIQDIIKAFR